ncbi:hypothetical protein AAH978_21650, partial [Streptomyces sp. ZYX-F-203]
MAGTGSVVSFEDVLNQAVRGEGVEGDWKAESDDVWCRVGHRSGVWRKQGWKLHVSATIGSAAQVLSNSLKVLLHEESGFKFVARPEEVAALNTRATPRGNAAKFITVYPVDDTAAVRIARDLHDATTGLPGPRILSDRPYAPDSLVHYRYGAFAARRNLSDKGLLVWCYEDPDGNLVEDKRSGEYHQPTWVTCPFPSHVPVTTRSRKDTAEPVLLDDRFAVREAIRHTNKGGVYRATEVATGTPVVIKEARPHVESDTHGKDVRDWTRAEATTLERLRHTGLTPRPMGLFETAGHLFLAQEEIPGIPLRNWVADRFRDIGRRRYLTEATQLIGPLLDLVATAHAQGCVLRDFTPSNVMVPPEGPPRLIDLELAAWQDQAPPPTRVGTPGFSAPERLHDAPVSPTADYYSLGATICFLLHGKVPNLLPEQPTRDTPHQRLARWLEACTRSQDTPELTQGTTELILG